eukprot:14942886-Alexandrium_andersonii.AAC.1
MPPGTTAARGRSGLACPRTSGATTSRAARPRRTPSAARARGHAIVMWTRSPSPRRGRPGKAVARAGGAVAPAGGAGARRVAPPVAPTGARSGRRGGDVAPRLLAMHCRLFPRQ